jgi:hypothetical protein
MLPVGLEQSEVRSVLVWSAQQVDVKMFTVDSEILEIARALAFGAAWQLRCVASDPLNP